MLPPLLTVLLLLEVTGLLSLLDGLGLLSEPLVAALLLDASAAVVLRSEKGDFSPEGVEALSSEVWLTGVDSLAVEDEDEEELLPCPFPRPRRLRPPRERRSRGASAAVEDDEEDEDERGASAPGRPEAVSVA